MEVANCQETQDYAYVLGLRNSHDKRFPAGLAVGASVFVCDNLSFSGEIKIARKHTRHIVRDLPELVSGAVGQLAERWHEQARRIDAYRSHEIGDKQAHDLIVRALDGPGCHRHADPPHPHRVAHPAAPGVRGGRQNGVASFQRRHRSGQGQRPLELACPHAGAPCLARLGSRVVRSQLTPALQSKRPPRVEATRRPGFYNTTSSQKIAAHDYRPDRSLAS